MCIHINALNTQAQNQKDTSKLTNTHAHVCIFIYLLWYVDPLLGNNLEPNNETPAAREQILNKQVYAAATE
jgi:hypothetical protein